MTRGGPVLVLGGMKSTGSGGQPLQGPDGGWTLERSAIPKRYLHRHDEASFPSTKRL